MRRMHNINWRETVSDAWQHELADDAYSITGTLKFNNGRTIGKTTAHNILNSYWHKLDRTFFGHAANKGIGIERWVFSEYGSEGNNLHFHFKAKAPVEPYLFCCIANVMWSKFHRNTARGIYNWITPTILQAPSAGYTVKDTRHFSYDTMGLAASHRNIGYIDISTFQNLAQAQRILNKLSIEDIAKARPLVNWHIEQTIKHIYSRQHRTEVLGTQL